MKRVALALGLLCLLACQGEVYYKTPESTLSRYVSVRRMGSALDMEAALNCFRKEDKEWWSNKIVRVCELKYGKFNSLCAGGVADKSALWNDMFEPYGPESENVTSSNIDEKAGTATLVIDGKEFYFFREHKNWKFDSLFGIRDQLEDQYPELKQQ